MLKKTYTKYSFCFWGVMFFHFSLSAIVLPELRNNTRAFYRIVGSDSSEQHHRPSLRMSKRARIGYQDGFKSEEDVGVYTRVLTTDWLK